mmetsp:Transcript_1243/g.3639  ORF Transcript_1243/g.3639 Transcript_1243/m.3639 type:complete len:680 (+) Transcript_1243:584-2623(+)
MRGVHAGGERVPGVRVQRGGGFGDVAVRSRRDDGDVRGGGRQRDVLLWRGGGRERVPRGVRGATGLRGVFVHDGGRAAGVSVERAVLRAVRAAAPVRDAAGRGVGRGGRRERGVRAWHERGGRGGGLVAGQRAAGAVHFSVGGRRAGVRGAAVGRGAAGGGRVRRGVAHGREHGVLAVARLPRGPLLRRRGGPVRAGGGRGDGAVGAVDGGERAGGGWRAGVSVAGGARGSERERAGGGAVQLHAAARGRRDGGVGAAGAAGGDGVRAGVPADGRQGVRGVRGGHVLALGRALPGVPIPEPAAGRDGRHVHAHADGGRARGDGGRGSAVDAGRLLGGAGAVAHRVQRVQQRGGGVLVHGPLPAGAAAGERRRLPRPGLVRGAPLPLRDGPRVLHMPAGGARVREPHGGQRHGGVQQGLLWHPVHRVRGRLLQGQRRRVRRVHGLRGRPHQRAHALLCVLQRGHGAALHHRRPLPARQRAPAAEAQPAPLPQMLLPALRRGRALPPAAAAAEARRRRGQPRRQAPRARRRRHRVRHARAGQGADGVVPAGEVQDPDRLLPDLQPVPHHLRDPVAHRRDRLHAARHGRQPGPHPRGRLRLRLRHRLLRRPPLHRPLPPGPGPPAVPHLHHRPHRLQSARRALPARGAPRRRQHGRGARRGCSGRVVARVDDHQATGGVGAW